MRNKIVDAAEAVAIIRSGDTVASSGFVGVGTPEQIAKIDKSHTGKFLRSVLSKSSKRLVVVPNGSEGSHKYASVTLLA